MVSIENVKAIYLLEGLNEQILEKLCIKYSDRIIVVVEENKDRLLSRGVEYPKILIVSNTVDINTFDNSQS